MSQGNNIQEQFGKFVEQCVMKDGNLLTQETNKLFTDANIQLTCEFLRKIKPLFDKKNEAARDANKKAKKKEVKTWGIGDIFDGSVFRNDFEDLDNDHEEIIIEILLHCNWLMYLCSDRQHKQDKALKYYKGKDEIADCFNTKTWWAIGPTFSGTSLDAMLFILKLILEVRRYKLKDQKDWIEKIEVCCIFFANRLATNYFFAIIQ